MHYIISSAYTSHTHLVQVFGLDLVSGLAHLAGSLGIGKHQLVDDDVVCVDVALGQLLDQPLGLVQGQEFGDAHADERRLLLFRHTRGETNKAGQSSVSLGMAVSNNTLRAKNQLLCG